MGESRLASLRVGAGAHRGLVREENQDRISRVQSPLGELFIVADGMGGHQGGATAAQMLIDGLAENLRALPPETPPEEALRQAAQKANANILRRAREDRRLARMGATAVLALVQPLPQGHRAWIAHAGDSRAYLWRDGKLERLTRDHTLVQRMVDHQILDEEAARNHPDANVVTRGFGQSAEVELEVGTPLPLREGDRLLLCSDGLSGYVDDDAIAQALAAEGEAQAATDALIDLALQAGGEDNVSLQLIAVQGEEAPARVPPPVAAAATREPRRGLSGFLLVLPLLLVAVLAGTLLPWRSWLASAAPPEPTAPPAPVSQIPPGPAEPSGLTDPTDLTDPYAAAGTEPAETPFPAAPPESAPPQPPRITVVIPPGLAQPPVRQRVLRAYPGNWSTPEALEERLAGSLAQGHVYHRAGFGPASAHLAGELGYAAAPWPEALAREHAEADLLVVYGGTP